MSTKWIYLSHVLSDKTPGYGGKPHFKVTPASEISCGHSSNSGIWEFRNHMGTHMDAPKHFVDSGKTMDSYEASEWVYSKTCLVKIQAQADLLILPEHVSEQIQKDCELLLIKTGWEKFRTETKYWEHNPGLSPQLGKWLRENCPNLRMVGFDFISLTAFQHREVGREAHRTFLSAQGREAIMIAEDMSLDKLSSAPKKVIIAPLRIENADGGPITVLAEI